MGRHVVEQVAHGESAALRHLVLVAWFLRATLELHLTTDRLILWPRSEAAIVQAGNRRQSLTPHFSDPLLILRLNPHITTLPINGALATLNPVSRLHVTGATEARGIAGFLNALAAPPGCVQEGLIAEPAAAAHYSLGSLGWS